jgi:uncharacterized repeat protein (TIGR01451 family)
MRIAIALTALAAALTASAPALAAPVELTSQIYVERHHSASDGTDTVTLVPADRVVPGDRLLFVVIYRNAGDRAASDFVITNPIPASVAFVAAKGDLEPTVSVDGGASYGTLASRRIRQPDGTLRPARPDEVTHLQWKFESALAGGGAGQVAFRAELR